MPHAEREHALLSASGAHRWLACPPSARLEERVGDAGAETSVYAAEGTLAHEVAEVKVRHLIGDLSDEALAEALDKLKERGLTDGNGNPLDVDQYWPEILRHTDDYVDLIAEIRNEMDKPYIAVEQRVDYSRWVPEGFGTADCVIIGGGTLHVVDLKYGTGVPVQADGNPQIRLYALGALERYGMIFPIEEVAMTIFQPRRESISTERLTKAELLSWAEGVKQIAEKAFRGEGDFVVGDHCQFCKAKAVCRARAEYFFSLEPLTQRRADTLTVEEIADALERGRKIAGWVADLEEHALHLALSGVNIPGWKVVEGRRKRDYTNVDEAFRHLIENGIDEAILYERKPLSVAKLEKALGKKTFRELVEPFVKTEPGKPTLAPESDKREAIDARTQAVDVFKNN